ncbi:MAG: hypothetical protein ABL962_01425 [Fimbriimonadaceae bacterium]
MIAAIALLIIQPAYQFPLGKSADYNLNVEFDGFVPMLGGIEGKITVDLGLKVSGLAPKGDLLAIAADLTAAEVRLDGEKLPFTVDNIRKFFPKNTIAATTLGEIKENDAPDIKTPVRLPGLDVKRLPDISYMPIQFPAELFDGQMFKFEKTFGDSKMTYEATPKFEGNTIIFSVKIAQTYTNYEDESKNLLDKPDEAFAKVVTDVNGAGTIVFDLKTGMVTQSKMVADAISQVTEIKKETNTQRKLKTTLTCVLRK